MKKNMKLLISLSVVVVLVALIFWHQMQKTNDVKSDIKIGAILPLTGVFAFAGESCRNGMLLAVEKFNETDPNIIIQVLCEDGKGTSKDSLSSYNKLLQKNITMFFCAASVTAEAIVNPLLKQLTLLAIVSDSKITLKNNNVYNLTVNSNQEISTIFRYLAGKNFKKIAIIYQKDELGSEINDVSRHFAPLFNLSIIANEEVSDAETVSSAIARVLAKHPEAIFIGTAGNNAALIAKKLRESNYSGRICALKSFNTPRITNQAGEAANGIYICYTPYDLVDSQEELLRFKTSYKARFNTSPDIMAAYSFCIIDLALKACKEAHFDIEKTKQILSATKDQPSIFGPITCAEDRIFVFPIDVGILNNGQIQLEE